MSRVWRDDKDKDLSNDDIAQKSLGRKAFCHFHQSKRTTTMYIRVITIFAKSLGPSVWVANGVESS